MLPGESLFSSWLNFIFLIALLIVGIFIYRIITSILANRVKVNQKTKENLEQTVDKIYSLPHPLKVTLKVLGTLVYIGVCILIIALSSS